MGPSKTNGSVTDKSRLKKQALLLSPTSEQAYSQI